MTWDLILLPIQNPIRKYGRMVWEAYGNGGFDYWVFFLGEKSLNLVIYIWESEGLLGIRSQYGPNKCNEVRIFGPQNHANHIKYYLEDHPRTCKWLITMVS